MPYRNAEADLQRAKEMRKLAGEAQDENVKKRFREAATRLERRAARKASDVGRPRKPSRNAPRYERR